MNEIFARRSIRKFLPTMVEDEKIEQLLRSSDLPNPWPLHLPETNNLGNFMSSATNGSFRTYLNAVRMQAVPMVLP